MPDTPSARMRMPGSTFSMTLADVDGSERRLRNSLTSGSRITSSAAPSACGAASSASVSISAHCSTLPSRQRRSTVC